MSNKGLVWIGRITSIAPIPQADRIELATVICGKGGRWRGCVPRGQFRVGDLCEVYLQDSILPPLPEFAFMQKHGYRVRIMTLQGVVSECLIMPQRIPGTVGDDITESAGVTKYEKPIPVGAQGIAGAFPSFIPKTDEPHFQTCPVMIEALWGKPFYSTVKVDGTSITAYRHEGHFGICSRSWEIRQEGEIAELVLRYNLEGIPTGIAIQFELAGPKIQGNPLGLAMATPFLFNVWHIKERRYGNWEDVTRVASQLNMPTVPLLEYGRPFNISPESLQDYAIGTYPNGKQREGVVIRPVTEMVVNGERLSFKVINPNYKG